MSDIARQKLLDMKAGLELRLSGNEEYRSLKAIETVLGLMDAEQGKASFKQPAVSRHAFARAVRRIRSQADAAEQVLIEHGSPMSTNDLIAPIQGKGINIGGNDPAMNLASSLSRDSRFTSLRNDGKSMWWLKAIEITPEEIMKARSLFDPPIQKRQRLDESSDADK